MRSICAKIWSQTWAGTPLTSFDLVLDGIRRTTTVSGLSVSASLVEDRYQTGLTVSKAEMAALNIVHHAVCPQWNYTIYPRSGNNF